VQYLIKDVEGVENCKIVSKALDNCEGSKSEAQSFIISCAEALSREETVRDLRFVCLPTIHHPVDRTIISTTPHAHLL
jgi:hypothetical protein